MLAERESKRNIRNSKNRKAVLNFLYIFYSCQSCNGCLVVGTYSHGKRVYDDVFFRDSVFCGFCVKLFYNLNSFFCAFRNSAFIQGKGNNHTAVFFYKREDLFHNFLFSVYRINKRLSVINAEGLFHSNRVRGIDLKRQICDSLKLLDDSFHHAAFINFRKADIYVQNLSTFFFLGNSFVEDVGNVLVVESLLELLFSSRINSLADKNRSLSELNNFCSRGYN